MLPTSITTRLTYQHKSLLDIIDGLSDEDIRRHIIADKWSIFENIVHLATYQHEFVKRIKRILAEENPVLERYTADADPNFHENCSKPIREIMQDLLALRKDMAAEIPAFSDADVQKTGVHPLFGKMNINMWLNFFLLHEAHHLFTIMKLKAALQHES